MAAARAGLPHNAPTVLRGGAKLPPLPSCGQRAGPTRNEFQKYVLEDHLGLDCQERRNLVMTTKAANSERVVQRKFQTDREAAQAEDKSRPEGQYCADRISISNGQLSQSQLE